MPFSSFCNTNAWPLVSSTAREKGGLDERGMSGDERSQQRREPTDRYGNEVKRETEI